MPQGVIHGGLDAASSKPLVDVRCVEADEVTHLVERDPPFVYQPADEPLGHSETSGQIEDVEEAGCGCCATIVARHASTTGQLRRTSGKVRHLLSAGRDGSRETKGPLDSRSALPSAQVGALLASAVAASAGHSIVRRDLLPGRAVAVVVVHVGIGWVGRVICRDFAHESLLCR